MKRIILSIVAAVLSITCVPALYSVTKPQSVDIEKKTVLYQLPYPGLLPGHPLYILKVIRDNILIFTTRDNQKKAKLYLHLSDKNMSTSIALINEGKEQAAIEQLKTAERRFLLIPPILQELKSQGGEYASAFIVDLSQSNQKHREVITLVIGKVTESDIDVLDELLEQNTKAKDLLQEIR
ncbi:MAG: DUF5667 domain-containing protein [Candidatus Roizmanbacteria bacterium]|nr:DUF5667 domain-containing protein [Candidatus Roizmanbacteria bacterium]